MIIERSNSPQPRFGHTITPINPTKVLLFAGAIGDTVHYTFSNELFVYNVPAKQWKKVQTIGTKPSPRAAHATICVDPLKFLVFGGATAQGEMAADELNQLVLTDDTKGQWSVIKTTGKTPGKRYGHIMAYNKPFVVVFGGNRNKIVEGKDVQDVNNQTWLLNLNGRPLAWQQFEGESPSPRVYHSAALCVSGQASGMIVVFGGRDRGGQALNDTWGFRRHRSGRWDWTKAPYRDQSSSPTCRYQHSSLFIGSMMIVIGGRSNPPIEEVHLEMYDTDSSDCSWKMIKCEQRFRHASWSIDKCVYNYGGFEESLTSATDSIQIIPLDQAIDPEVTRSSTPSTPSTPTTPSISEDRTRQPTLFAPGRNSLQKEKKFKMVSEVSAGEHHLANYFLSELCSERVLRNRVARSSQANYRFKFEPDKIIELCEQVEVVLKNQPMVLRVKAPLKIYGDIHGQYTDLMEFFQIYGSPVYGTEDGDIQGFDYIFLGDFVDRGSHSLETVCLLFALKLKFPRQVHLIRGNHEDRGVNNSFGFLAECEERIGENCAEPGSVFNAFNQVFEWLPLAAVVEQKILCLHGGIGSTLKKISDIEGIKRPLTVVHTVTTHQEQLIVDILWSDPTESDAEVGILPNVIRDPEGTGHIVKFGPDIVSQFLVNNSISQIIRAHECVMEGFERFAGGKLITVFSATDYCGKHKNAGAMLTIKKTLEILPKLIRPRGHDHHNWIEDEESLKKRPPTPPRWKNNPRKYS